jgi:hydroxypyruvate isomerase
MLGNMLGGLFDTESIVRDTIQQALENIAEELQCTHNELFIMIKPINEEFDMKFYVYKIEQSPKLIREITLKEILGGD